MASAGKPQPVLEVSLAHLLLSPTRPLSPLVGRVGTQFLTNVFFPVYLAQRLRPDSPEQPAAAVAKAGSQAQQQQQPEVEQAVALPGYAPAMGAVAAAVGAASIAWALAARPEVGGLAERWEFFTTVILTAKFSRIDWAFTVDSGLYAVWQAWLLGACRAPAVYRFVPFFGLAGWLMAGGPTEGTASPARQQHQQ